MTKVVILTSFFKQCLDCKVVCFSPIWYYFHRKKCNSFHFTTRNRSHLNYQENINQLEKWVQCDQCKFKTIDKKKLKIHINTKHLPIEFQHQSQCDHTSNCKGGITRHKRRKHTSSELQKKFQCGQCDYVTIYKHYLTEHTNRKHTSSEFQKHFQCDQCEHKSICKNDLRKHKNRKHPLSGLQEQFRCDQCEYTSIYKHYVAEHVKKRHILSKLEQKFQCDQCELTFIYKNGLQKHILSKHTPSELQKHSNATYVHM